MKKIVILTFIIATGLSFTSCSKFLDTQPISNGIYIDEATDTIMYNTAEDAEAALGAAYADFKNEYYELDFFVNGDAQSDDAYAGADNASNFQIDDCAIDAINSNVSRDWAYLYSTIGKTNSVINNVNDTPDPALTTERKKQMIGEASFIRAYQYFQLVQLWGAVPLQLKEVKYLSAENLPEVYPILYPPRASVAEVYAQIILDLETALSSGLAATNVGGVKQYATLGSVNTLLAYVYATQEPHDWNKVSTYCDAVIGGGYSLLPNYDDLWNNENENSSESIFEINYTGGSTDGNWGTKMFRGMDWKKFNIPSNDLVRAFQSQNDTVRMNSSIIWEDVSGHWNDIHWPQTEYPFLNKWRIFIEGSDNNYIFYRLADVLLLKAEALNELGDVNGAATLVNQIRTRAKLSNTTASTQDAMRSAIALERRLELAFEGHRWFDLKRTGQAIQVMNNATGANGENLGYQLNQNTLVWPIPQSELDKNKQLVQNPGY
jgi:hypothetical protein